jgi:hypothetical protein
LALAARPDGVLWAFKHGWRGPQVRAMEKDAILGAQVRNLRGASQELTANRE